MKQKQYEYFSLGYRCTTSGLLKSMGLKHESYPFDWNISRLNVIKECIIDEFKEFINIENYQYRHTKTYDMMNSMNYIVCDETILYNTKYQSVFNSDHTYEAKLAFNHKNLFVKDDYDYYVRCIERFQKFIHNDSYKMGVYMSPMIFIDGVCKEIDEIHIFDSFICNFGKNIMKNVYFLIIKDSNQPNAKLELYETLENGSQIFKVYVRPHIMDAGEFFIENTTDLHSFEECTIIKKVIERSMNIERKQTTTFVSCLVDLYDKTVRFTLEERLQQFAYLANSDILLYVYACNKSRILLENFIKENGYINIKILSLIGSYKDLPLYSNCLQYENIMTLPDQRNTEKDNIDYISLMFSKLDFINIALKDNPFHTENFAWIDFSIMHMVKNGDEKKYVQKYLKQISYMNSCNDSIIIPGCWSKLENMNFILNHINWRFCGSFFVGNTNAIKEFYKLHTEYLPIFIREYNKLVWEVNFWAYLEYKYGWKPIWYDSDHNRRILEIPSKYFIYKLEEQVKCTNYMFEDTPGYFPSSCSFIEYKNKYILNTRFVNYKLTPQGYYIIYHAAKHLHSENSCSLLDENLQNIDDTFSMNVKTDLVCNGGSIYGLEDVRLFISENETLKFICTNVNYSKTGTNSMIIGDYDFESQTMNNMCIIKSPEGCNRCEKNWIPLPYHNVHQTQYYIYSWNPMKIGKIVDNQLQIVYTYENDHPLLNRARGSTIFQQNGEGLLGVVHFSDEGCPRNYYHMLVLLDSNTYKPIKYSKCFYFHEFSIEFCTGLFIKDNKYYFFISNFDRNPELFVINNNVINSWFIID